MRKKHTNVIKFKNPETNLSNKALESPDFSPINKIFQQIRKNIIGIVLAASAIIHIAPFAKTTEHEKKIASSFIQKTPKTKLSLVEKMKLKPETIKALEKDGEIIKDAVDKQFKNAKKRQENLTEYKSQLKEKNILEEDFAEINFQKDYLEQGVNQSIIDIAKNNFNHILKQLEKEKPEKPTPEFLAKIVEKMGGKSENYERTMGVTSKSLALNFAPGSANCNVKMEATAMAFSKLYPKLKDQIKINFFRDHVRAAVTLDDGKTYLLEGNSQSFPDQMSTKYKNSLANYHDQLRLWIGEITQDQFDQKLIIYGPKKVTETKGGGFTTQLPNGLNSKIELDDFGNAEEAIEISLNGYGQNKEKTDQKQNPEEKSQLEETRQKVLQANFAKLQKLDIQPLDNDQPQIVELIGSLTKEEVLQTLDKTKNLKEKSLKFPNLTIDDDAFAEIIKQKDFRISLNINNISPKQAELLKDSKLSIINFSNTLELSVDLSKKIAAFKGDALAIEVPTSFTPEIAKELASFKGKELYLNGLTSITPEIAKELASFKGESLSLNELTSITPEIAKELASFKSDTLNLDDLSSITPTIAKELASFKGKFLTLDGLTSITPKIAKELTAIKKGSIVLRGLISITPEIAKELAASKQEAQSLDGLTSITPEIAKELASFKGQYLNLNGLTSITLEIAKELANFKGKKILLEKLTSIPNEIAVLLINFTMNRNIWNQVTIITPQIAKKLATIKEDHLVLNGLTTITPEIARELAAFNKTALSVDGLTFITTQVAKELATFKGQNLYLNGLTTITPEIAKELATFKRNFLGLNGLTSITPEMARELAAFKGDFLGLNGLTSITSEIARELAAFKGNILGLNGLTSITPEIAKELATFKGKNLLLNNLSSITPEVAKELAAFKGSILDPNGKNFKDNP